MFTGTTHMPTPTKTMHFANSNSLLGNAKGAHDVMVNTLPKIEMIVHHEWYWTASCEYADVVFGVDSWPERQLPDVYGSVSNPFLQAWCATPMERVFDTLDDMEVNALVAARARRATRRPAVRRLLALRHRGEPGVYIQRVFDAGNADPRLPLRRPPRVVQEGHALLHDVSAPCRRSSAGSRPTRASRGTRSRDGSSSTVTRTSSSSTARTCRCTASRSTAPSTSPAC